MKILIVSDTHGHSELLDDYILKHKDVDIFLHAGDAEVPPHTLYPFRVVRGNCDYYYDAEKEYIIPTPFGNLLIRHKDDANETYLQDNDIIFYVYGHTHVKACKKKHGICYINPGSLAYPRDDTTSYAILDVDFEGAYCSFFNSENDELIKKYHIYIGIPPKVEEGEPVKEDTQLEEVENILRDSPELREQIKEEIKNELLDKKGE